MTVSEEERGIRRRLVYNAMPEGTSEAVLQSAIEILENEFGDKPEIRYTELAKRLDAGLTNHAVNLGGFLGRLMMLRSKPPEEIGPDPNAGGFSQQRSPTPKTESSVRKRSATSAPSSELDTRCKMFNVLFTAAVDCVAKHGDGRVIDLAAQLKKDADKLGLLAVTHRTLLAWTNNPLAPSSIVGSTPDLHKIINSSFVWMCKTFGPTEADRYLLQGVRQAEQLPEAFDEPPKQFL